jgi:hypothetical protein
MIALALLLGTFAALESPDAAWLPLAGGAPGTDGPVAAWVVFDDGQGPALYAGGTFSTAGGALAPGIARWDGEVWTGVGGGALGVAPGIAPLISSLAVFDDGSGPALYAGGTFGGLGGVLTNGLGRWDGQQWSAVGGGLDGSVHALAVHDDGTGPALYAGGPFTSAGGVPAARIARWDGARWSAVGTGFNAQVRTLAVYDDGSGAELIAGGHFTASGSGGHPLPRVARWDGVQWQSLGPPVLTGGPAVRALAVFDEGLGQGPVLFVGGQFTSLGGVAANHLARWDGVQWSALGSGLDGLVESLAVYDDGGGARLHVGGNFDHAGGLPAAHAARWDGANWAPLAGGANASVQALAVFDGGDGRGPSLFAGGLFSSAAGLGTKHVARWDGSRWTPVGAGFHGAVHATASFDDGLGGGAQLIAGGSFVGLGNGSLPYLARFDGEQWHGLGAGADASVYALETFDDGSGPALYAAGAFTELDGGEALRIGRWDGAAWSPVGGGLDGIAYALEVFDDGEGQALYVAGSFTFAGGRPANRVARWDGEQWSELGAGILGVFPTVHTLAVFDDGGGPALFAGGDFHEAGSVIALHVARWSGAEWSALGPGLNNDVFALAPFDDGGGMRLYAGGFFTSAGGLPAPRLAAWDGEQWSAVGSGADGLVSALAVFDSGAGPELVLGGHFDSVGGVPAASLARWDGEALVPFDGGVHGAVVPAVRELAVHVTAARPVPTLHIGGNFQASPPGDSHLARYGPELGAVTAVPGCAGNPAALTALSPALELGGSFDLLLTAASPSTGLLFLGLDGTDARGCGTVWPGLGELLLSLVPAPLLLGSGPTLGGEVAFALPVPDEPALLGAQVLFQGLAVGGALELSTALRATFGP